MREIIAWKTHKGLKWYLFWDKECLDRKSPKIGNVFNPHKSLPDRQPNAASRKRPLSQNEEPFGTKTLFK